MKKMFLILFFALSLAPVAYGYENQFALKAGVGYTTVATRTYYNKSESEDEDHGEDEYFAINLTTQFGYRARNWEFGINSLATMGYANNILFDANGTMISGKGITKSTFFTPILKYLWHSKITISSLEYRGHWLLYLGGGPTWSIQTIKLSGYQQNFNSDYRIKYNSYGATLVFGIEEDLKSKQEYPFFIETMLGYAQAYRVAIVDVSDQFEVQLLSRNNPRNKIQSFYWAFNLGITLF